MFFAENPTSELILHGCPYLMATKQPHCAVSMS
ncbi:hypothetical protein KSS87_012937 [Heliosperma pusillum]|nr:hypothetical protein KSS87_012937 [Heliosperma pusillum]